MDFFFCSTLFLVRSIAMIKSEERVRKLSFEIFLTSIWLLLNFSFYSILLTLLLVAFATLCINNKTIEMNAIISRERQRLQEKGAHSIDGISDVDVCLYHKNK